MSLPSSKILRLITPTIFNNRKEILRMMRWRIENQQYYASQPKITEESFRNWLVEHVFGKQRLLFWVIDEKGNSIGHMGLNQFKGISCEIDNVLRGVNRVKGRMTKALQVLMRWTIKNAPILELHLRVLSTNTHAIAFYKNNGFVPLRLVMVKKGSPLRFLKMKYYEA